MTEIEIIIVQLEQAFQQRSWHGTNLLGSIRRVKPAEAAWRPAAGRHNIWELIVHTAYWKYAVCRRFAGLERGSFPFKGSNGVKTLKGGKIRSALRLREQLFVINKRYSGNQVTGYTFTGRGWGHGVGMCQYGAYGLAKMGVKSDEIIKHYYSGVDVTKAY